MSSSRPTHGTTKTDYYWQSYIRNSIVLGACSFILHVCAYWCCITLSIVHVHVQPHFQTFLPSSFAVCKNGEGGLAHFNTEGMSVSTEVDGGRKREEGSSKGSWNLSVQVLEALLIRKNMPLFGNTASDQTGWWEGLGTRHEQFLLQSQPPKGCRIHLYVTTFTERMNSAGDFMYT